MAGFGSIRTMLFGGAVLAFAGASPAMADDIYADEWNQLPDLVSSAMGSDQLGGVVAQPLETAWQQIDLPQETELTTDQKSELNQIKTGVIEYEVAIPPEEREEGGPTTKIVTAPAPFGGLDHMVEALAGSESGFSGSQFQSADVGDLSSGGFLQSDLGNALGSSSALTDALTGFQGQ